VVRHEDAQRCGRARRGRPLFLIDIAVPRDIDPRVHEIDNVYLYDLDDLRRVVEGNRDERRHEAALAEAIVERETEAYLARARAQAVGPAIQDLTRRLHAIGEQEVTRFRGRLGGLTPEQERTVRDLAASLVNKVLHQPILALKRAARDGGGERVALMRELFGLGPEAPGAGAAPPDEGAARDLDGAAVAPARPVHGRPAPPGGDEG
jgi:glutamyl-tRNA reductase